MGNAYYDHMSGWGVAATSIGSLLFAVALVLGVVALLRHLRGAPPAPQGRPEQLLAARYARGEIDDDEYHHRLDTLRGTSAAAPVTR